MSFRFLNRIGSSSKSIFFYKNITRAFHKSCPALYAAPIQLKMPSLSPTMTEGNIVKWLKNEGDQVVPGDVLMEIQTDKAIVAFETEEEGVLAKILVPEDSKNIQVGTLVGLLSLPGDDWKSVAVPEESGNASTQAAVQISQEPSASAHGSSETTQKIGPAARNLVQLYGVDISKLKASGPHGFILKRINFEFFFNNYIDVKAYIDQNGLKPQSVEASPVQETRKEPETKQTQVKKPSGSHPEYQPDYQDIELSNMRKVIAKRLVFSKSTIPHSYITANCLVDKIIHLRKEMIKKNQKVSINDFISKAVALALRLVPELNSNMNEKTSEYTQLKTVDISIAVATENGLITPIVKDADKIDVLDISENVKVLAEKARQGKLMPHEFQGGSFTISNLGMFGISEFSAVINPPQIAILAVGKSQLKFNTNMDRQTEISMTLSYDERCCSLDRAQTFMNTLNYFLSNPDLLVQEKPDL